MSEPVAPAPRPVSTVAVAAIFVLFSLFYVASKWAYVPTLPPAPQNQAADNLPKDLAWRATPEARKATLADLRKRQAEQAASYGWVDQKAGIVQVPIDRAMELVVKENGGQH
jgi:hypothetical protein